MTMREQLVTAMRRRFEDTGELPVAVSVAPEVIRDHLDSRYDFGGPLPLEALFDDADRMLRIWTEHASHPMHFGLFRPNVDEVSVVADALAALYDPNLAAWDFAPAANEIERHTLSAIAARFGLDAGSMASHFTSGGLEANHTAVVVALTKKFPEVARRGLRALPGQPVFYVSEEAHHSLDKVAGTTGLGREAIRWIRATRDLRMDVELLREQVERDRADGLHPFMVVSTAGTTNAGVIDPLQKIGDAAEQHGLWHHVDAAWGGAAALSDRLRAVLSGIERADSIACDAHKWISAPVGAGMFYCRHPEVLDAAFGTDTPYVPVRASSRRQPFMTSMQWSRRFIGFKVFLMFAARGMPEIARRIEHQAVLGNHLRRRLRERGWTIQNDTPLPVVCFSHDDLAVTPGAGEAIAQALRQEGAAWISTTLLRGRLSVLRACITNFSTQSEHVDRLVALLEEKRLPFHLRSEASGRARLGHL